MESDKKKRGRKPKADEHGDADKKKRGRKPKSVYNVNDAPSIPPSNCLSDDENIIVRLQVNADSDSETSDDPHAYNKDTYDAMEFSTTMDMSCYEHNTSCVTEDVGNIHELKVVHVLKDFEEKNKNNEWPSNTSICCYWCCHKFDNAPYGIPVSYHNNQFDVYGCFCSLECASAYNFKTSESLDETWERYNLINLLARKMRYYGDKFENVKPAPERLTLRVFGGFLDIDEFRNYNKTHKVINVNFPPMTSLTQQIEEINEYELNSDMRFIPLDSERLSKCKEKMMFKRSKPIVNENSTLESVMNLKIC